MVFQTRQLTASAGDDLVHPAKHGLPPSTETVDIPVTRAGAGGWVRAAARVASTEAGQSAAWDTCSHSHPAFLSRIWHCHYSLHVTSPSLT